MEAAPGNSQELALQPWMRLARKELREILRDRRTLLTLVLMPLLLYPLLGLGFSVLYGPGGRSEQEGVQFRLGFEDEALAQHFLRLLNRGERAWRSRLGGQSDPETAAAEATPSLISFVDNEPEERLRWGQFDLVIRARSSAEEKERRDRLREFEVTYDPDSPTARQALHYIESRLIGANLFLNEENLHRLGADRLAQPLRVYRHPIVQEKRNRGFLLAVLVPLVLILMTMTGAVYPAIDLTAGERERGTLELLMATPVPRVALLGAKYVAVLAVAVLTALVNLAMMAVSFVIFGRSLLTGGALNLSFGMIPVVLILVLLFAAFYAAVLLVIASFARSFKEAQAYVVPLMLVSLIPGLLALLPELQLHYGVALVPLLNIVLLARDLLSGSAEPGAAVIVVVSTFIYSWVALLVAARTFGAEAVLYSDGRSWSDWFRGFWRK
jgi:ABC-2 type transport system permease protein/sodium transport system permease protein